MKKIILIIPLLIPLLFLWGCQTLQEEKAECINNSWYVELRENDLGLQYTCLNQPEYCKRKCESTYSSLLKRYSEQQAYNIDIKIDLYKTVKECIETCNK